MTSSELINSDKAPKPVGAYPHARKVGELLFLSGVGPRSPKDNSVPGNITNEAGEVTAYDAELQTEAVISNVKAVLESSGSSLEKVVDVQVFLTNMKADFKTFNAVYKKHFENIQATRTTVEVGALPTPIVVEFKVIALMS